MSETLKEGLLKRGRYSIGEMFYRSVECRVLEEGFIGEEEFYRILGSKAY